MLSHNYHHRHNHTLYGYVVM